MGRLKYVSGVGWAQGTNRSLRLFRRTREHVSRHDSTTFAPVPLLSINLLYRQWGFVTSVISNKSGSKNGTEFIPIRRV